MEIHRQTCQACGSRNLRNLVVRIPGKHEKIYVQCRSCKELVVRYVVGEMGYFHCGKGIESFLRSLENSGDMVSGKNLRALYEQINTEEHEHFRELLEKMEELGKNDDL